MPYTDNTLVSALTRSTTSLLDELGALQLGDLDSLETCVAKALGTHVAFIPWRQTGMGARVFQTDDGAYVFYDAAAPDVRTIQCIGHEIAHLLYGDGRDPDDLADFHDQIEPYLSAPIQLRAACARSTYADPREIRAELLGSALVQRWLYEGFRDPTSAIRRRTVFIQRIAAACSSIADVHAVHPLWRAVTDSVPGIALLPRYQGLRTIESAVRNVALQRVRSTVEIHDGLVRLQPWSRTGVARTATHTAIAHGLDPQRADAVIDAAVLLDAMISYRVGGDTSPRPEDGGYKLTAQDPSPGHLRRVSRALNRSRVVSEVMTELGHLAPSPSRRRWMPPLRTLTKGHSSD